MGCTNSKLNQIQKKSPKNDQEEQHDENTNNTKTTTRTNQNKKPMMKNFIIISNEKSTQTDNNYLEEYFKNRIQEEMQLYTHLYSRMENNKSPNHNLEPSIIEERAEENPEKLPPLFKKKPFNPDNNKDKEPLTPICTSSHDLNELSKLSNLKNHRVQKPLFSSMQALKNNNQEKRGFKEDKKKKKEHLDNREILRAAQREIFLGKKGQKDVEKDTNSVLKIPNKNDKIQAEVDRKRSKTSIIQKSNPDEKNNVNADDDDGKKEENRFKIFRTQKSKNSFLSPKVNKKKKKRKKKKKSKEQYENFLRQSRISRVLSSSSSSSSMNEESSSISESEELKKEKEEKNYQFPPIDQKKVNITTSSHQSNVLNGKMTQSLAHQYKLESMQTNKDDSINTISIKGRREIKNVNKSLFKERNFNNEISEPFTPNKSHNVRRNILEGEEISPLLKNHEEMVKITKDNVLKLRSNQGITHRKSSRIYSKRDDIIKSNKLIKMSSGDVLNSKKKSQLNIQTKSVADGLSPRKRNFSNIPEVDEVEFSNSGRKSKKKISKKEKKDTKRLSIRHLLYPEGEKEEENKFPKIMIDSPKDNLVVLEPEKSEKLKEKFEKMSKEDIVNMKSKLYRRKKTIVKNTPEIIMSEGLKRRRQSHMNKKNKKDKDIDLKRQLSMRGMIENRDLDIEDENR